MKLEAIAYEMQDQARAVGRASRTLERGLQLQLERRGPNERLTIRRTATVPSATEMDIVRKAFGVPQWATEAAIPNGVRLRWRVVTTWLRPARNGNQWLWYCAQPKREAA